MYHALIDLAVFVSVTIFGVGSVVVAVAVWKVHTLTHTHIYEYAGPFSCKIDDLDPLEKKEKSSN